MSCAKTIIMEAYVLLTQMCSLNHYDQPGSLTPGNGGNCHRVMEIYFNSFFFSKIGRSQFLLHCYYDSKCLKEFEIPFFL